MFKEIKSSKTFQKSLRKFKEFNLKVRIMLGIKKASPTTISNEEPQFIITQKVHILSAPNLTFIAKLIQNQFNRFHISSEIILDAQTEEFNEDLYFVIGLYDLPSYPENYIFFQTEKIIGYNDELFDLLRNAKCVFDYSLENIDFLEINSIPYRKLFYIPFDPIDISGESEDKEVNEIQQKLINQDKNKLHFANGSFSFYFNRFLLSNNIINYKQFIENTLHPILDKNFVCLSLPETTSRTKSFLNDIRNEIQIFHGLRHSIGWIGCGLSYKYLMFLASKEGLDYIMICEDDVHFPKDFDSKLESIISYLEKNKGMWDLFSGFIADVHRETDVKLIESYGKIDFVFIDKLMSMVFNIYNNSFYDNLSKWDENDLNKESNTIDRFIENSKCLKIITTLPYLVGIKENLASSIWANIHNNDFNKLIDKSTRLLDYKIRWYKRKNKLKSVLFKIKNRL